MAFTPKMDLGGIDLVVNSLSVATKTGATPTSVVTSGVIGTSKRNVISGQGATRTLTAAESGSLVLWDRAAGTIFTLPAATAANIGLEYDFFVTVTVTSNAHKIASGTQGTDWFSGTVLMFDSDTLTDPLSVQAGNGSSHDNVSMNGTTSGGLVGTRLNVVCNAVGSWIVQGIVHHSGSVATPFSAT